MAQSWPAVPLPDAGLLDWKGTGPAWPMVPLRGSRLGRFSVKEASLCPGQSPQYDSNPFLSHMVLQYFLLRLCPWLRDAKGSLAGMARSWQ